MLVTHNITNTVASSTSPPSTLLISGVYTVHPVTIYPPDRSKDLLVVIVVASLAVAHILACCVGNIVDRIRDARMQPDPELLLLPQNNLTLHRFVSIERKPHHPIATWMRVTTLFTYLFGHCRVRTCCADRRQVGPRCVLQHLARGWSLRSCQPLSPQLCASPCNCSFTTTRRQPPQRWLSWPWLSASHWLGPLSPRS